MTLPIARCSSARASASSPAGQQDRPGRQPRDAGQRPCAGLRLTWIIAPPGPSSPSTRCRARRRRPHAFGAHRRACGDVLGRIPDRSSRRRGPSWWARCPVRAGRPGLRVRLHPRRRPAQAQAAPQGADDHVTASSASATSAWAAWATARSHVGKRAAQRHRVRITSAKTTLVEVKMFYDHEPRRSGPRMTRSTRCPVAGDDAARPRAWRRWPSSNTMLEPARLRADRRAPAQQEVPQHLLGRRGDPAARKVTPVQRRAQDRLHDRDHGDGHRPQHQPAELAGQPATAKGTWNADLPGRHGRHRRPLSRCRRSAAQTSTGSRRARRTTTRP